MQLLTGTESEQSEETKIPQCYIWWSICDPLGLFSFQKLRNLIRGHRIMDTKLYLFCQKATPRLVLDLSAGPWSQTYIHIQKWFIDLMELLTWLCKTPDLTPFENMYVELKRSAQHQELRNWRVWRDSVLRNGLRSLCVLIIGEELCRG